KIKCPVLVIGAKDDKIFGEAEAVEIAKQLKSKELFMYDGYGHAVYDFTPDYKERMLNFFNLH
ncbi:MAG: alpha/beta hydrolase, partial [Synergistaceae bacterium]|nr:alpha/beta hydrolase [Synergistaceae bacterium]